MVFHQRNQVMYSLDIGSPHKRFNSKHIGVRDMAIRISKLTGGCTLVDSVGLWADVERADKESYHGFSIGVENNVQLQVKAEVTKEIKVETAIIMSIVEMTKEYPEFGIDWVCGHKVKSDGTTVSFNFSVKENEKNENKSR